MQFRTLAGILCLGLFTIACGEKENNNHTEAPKPGSANSFEATSPARGSLYRLGDTIPVVLSGVGSSPEVDSVEVYLDGTKVATVQELTYDWLSAGSTVGQHVLRLQVHYGDDSQSVRITTTLLSDVTPDIWTYQVVARFPHDTEAFTQGLEYYQGDLYEGTGQLGESSLRKVNLRTGEVVQRHDLESQFFGEGITRIGEELVQITWKSRVGIVYDLNTFTETRRFNYPTEGWGIANAGDAIVMSDGTNRLYFLHPDSFVQLHNVMVYDDKGPVKNLNELEIIDGDLYANIWMSDDIARIDMATGRVLSYIDMSGLLPASQRNGNEDVLNGIAHDPATGRTFVTGKYWPTLFEVQWSPVQ